MSTYVDQAKFKVGDTVARSGLKHSGSNRYEVVRTKKFPDGWYCYIVKEGRSDEAAFRSIDSAVTYDAFIREDRLEHALFGVDPETGMGLRTHPLSQCQGRGIPCVIHDPSRHHMRDWTMLWRADRGLMERLCAHGVGHPDPDDIEYKVSIGKTSEGVHGCDSCCAAPPPPARPTFTTAADIHNDILGRTPVPENRYIIVRKSADGKYDTDWDSSVWDDEEGALEGMGGINRRAAPGSVHKVVKVDIAAAFEAAPFPDHDAENEEISSVVAALVARGESKLARKLLDVL